MAYRIELENNVIERQMYYKNTMILHYKINYPQLRLRWPAEAAGRINRFYRTKALTFKRYCETELYYMAVKEYKYSVANGFPIRPYEADLAYTVTFDRDCYLSLYFDQYQFTGGAHGSTVRTSQTWNFPAGRRIALRQMFSPPVRYREFILKTVQSQIAQEIQNGNNIYFENYEQLTRETFRSENFYLTDQGLAVYFQQYDIAPYSSGIPVFIIPYGQGGLITPDCRSR